MSKVFLIIGATFFSLLTTACASFSWAEQECTKSQLVEICFLVGGKPAFVDAFRSVSVERVETNKRLIAQKLGINVSEIKEIEKSNPIVQIWNSKAQISLFKKKELVEEVVAAQRTPLKDGPSSSVIKIRSDHKVVIDTSASKEWVRYFENHPEENSSCMIDGHSTPCAKLFGIEEVKKTAEKFRELFLNIDREKLSSASMLGMLMRLQKIELTPKGPYRVFEHTATTASPQIDNLGNFYVPRRFLEDLDSGDLELIMNHEAAHLVELQDGVVAWYLSSVIKENLQKPGSEQVDIMDDFLLQMRKPDEAIIDLLASYLFEADATSIRRMAALVDAYEGHDSIRGEVSRALALAVDAGWSTKSALLQRYKKIHTPCDIQSVANFKSSWSGAPISARNYVNAYAQYQAYQVPQRMVDFLGKNYVPLDFQSYVNYALEQLRSNGCVMLPFSAGNVNYAINLYLIDYRK